MNHKPTPSPASRDAAAAGPSPLRVAAALTFLAAFIPVIGAVVSGVIVVLVVLAVAVGSVLAGITGALLSVPLLAVLNADIRALLSGDAEPRDGTSGGASTVPAGSAFPPADVPADPEIQNP